jgi:hypothetical protein
VDFSGRSSDRILLTGGQLKPGSGCRRKASPMPWLSLVQQM